MHAPHPVASQLQPLDSPSPHVGSEVCHSRCACVCASFCAAGPMAGDFEVIISSHQPPHRCSQVQPGSPSGGGMLVAFARVFFFCSIFFCSSSSFDQSRTVRLTV